MFEFERKVLDLEKELEDLSRLGAIVSSGGTMMISESSVTEISRRRKISVRVPKLVNKYQNVNIIFNAIDDILALKKDNNKIPDLVKQKKYIKDIFEWQPIYENNGKDFVSAILSYKHNEIRIPWLQVKKANIHMGNDHDYVIQERICQYEMYLKRIKKLDLGIKNERMKTTFKELNKKYIDSLKSIGSTGSTVDKEERLKHKSCNKNNANIRTDFGCVTTKEIRSGEEITYEYNWVESSE